MCEDSSEPQLKEKVDKRAGEMNKIKHRLPAHSAQPPIMMELFELEARYDELCRRLEKMDKDGKGTSTDR